MHGQESGGPVVEREVRKGTDTIYRVFLSLTYVRLIVGFSVLLANRRRRPRSELEDQREGRTTVDSARDYTGKESKN